MAPNRADAPVSIFLRAIEDEARNAIKVCLIFFMGAWRFRASTRICIISMKDLNPIAVFSQNREFKDF